MVIGSISANNLDCLRSLFRKLPYYIPVNEMFSPKPPSLNIPKFLAKQPKLFPLNNTFFQMYFTFIK